MAASDTPTAKMREVEVAGLRLAYRELGSGPPVLLLHGWPTSSYLWRRVMPPIAAANRVLALDLPGFGSSSKPIDATYDAPFFDGVLDGFLEALQIESIGIAVHDLGGPVGLHWTVRNPERVQRLALLNTLVYPDVSEAVEAFIKACSTPGLRDQITSPAGLEAAIRLGLAEGSEPSAEVIAAVQEPFRDEEARVALARAGIGIGPEDLEEIARGLGGLTMPVRFIYGARDRILPDIGATADRIRGDLPQTEVTALPDCGHFCQEEAAEQIGAMLADFFAAD